MRRDWCRHYDASVDFCYELKVISPDSTCKGCEMFEPQQPGLGDVIEKVVDIATLGLVKKAVKAKKGGCGCKKRRAALNRLTGVEGVD